MLLTSEDATWLRETHPNLVPSENLDEVRGSIDFNAAYDKPTDAFTIIRSTLDRPPGFILQGSYKIHIKDIADFGDKERWLLPRTFIDDLDFPRSLDRHFSGESACLCGPSEESRLIREGYSFHRYLERLVIPFLYAQTFYEHRDEWPWAEYEHGIIGVFDSYAESGEANAIPLTLALLKLRKDWPKLHALLRSKYAPKGHMACLCGSGNHIRRCHASTWTGVKRLYADIRENKLASVI